MPAAVPREERDRIIAEALEEHLPSGARLDDIAQKNRLAPSTVCRWLLKEHRPEYREAQVAGLLQRVVDADEDLAAARNHFEINKHVARARFARWDCERRLPHLFATRTEISGPGGGPIEIEDNLKRARRFAFLQAQVERAPEPINVEPIEAPAVGPDGTEHGEALAALPEHHEAEGTVQGFRSAVDAMSSR